MKLFSRSKSSKSTKASASSPVDISHASTTAEFPSNSSRSRTTKSVVHKLLTSITSSLLRVLKGKRGGEHANRVHNDQVDAPSLGDEQIHSATDLSAPTERRNTTNVPSPSQTARREAPPAVSILIEKAMQAKPFVVAKGKQTWDFQTTLAFRTDIIVFSAHTSSVLPLSSPPSAPATASSSVPALVQPSSVPAVPQQEDDLASGLVNGIAALKMENGSSSSNPAQEDSASALDQISKGLQSMGLETAESPSSASGPDTTKEDQAKSSQSTNIGYAPGVDQIAEGFQSMGLGTREQGPSVQTQPEAQTDAAPPTNVDEEANESQETTENAQEDRENRGSSQPANAEEDDEVEFFTGFPSQGLSPANSSNPPVNVEVQAPRCMAGFVLGKDGPAIDDLETPYSPSNGRLSLPRPPWADSVPINSQSAGGSDSGRFLNTLYTPTSSQHDDWALAQPDGPSQYQSQQGSAATDMETLIQLYDPAINALSAVTQAVSAPSSFTYIEAADLPTLDQPQYVWHPQQPRYTWQSQYDWQTQPYNAWQAPPFSATGTVNHAFVGQQELNVPTLYSLQHTVSEDAQQWPRAHQAWTQEEQSDMDWGHDGGPIYFDTVGMEVELETQEGSERRMEEEVQEEEEDPMEEVTVEEEIPMETQATEAEIQVEAEAGVEVEMVEVVNAGVDEDEDEDMCPGVDINPVNDGSEVKVAECRTDNSTVPRQVAGQSSDVCTTEPNVHEAVPSEVLCLIQHATPEIESGIITSDPIEQPASNEEVAPAEPQPESTPVSSIVVSEYSGQDNLEQTSEQLGLAPSHTVNEQTDGESHLSEPAHAELRSKSPEKASSNPEPTIEAADGVSAPEEEPVAEDGDGTATTTNAPAVPEPESLEPVVELLLEDEKSNGELVEAPPAPQAVDDHLVEDVLEQVEQGSDGVCLLPELETRQDGDDEPRELEGSDRDVSPALKESESPRQHKRRREDTPASSAAEVEEQSPSRSSTPETRVRKPLPVRRTCAISPPPSVTLASESVQSEELEEVAERPSKRRCEDKPLQKKDQMDRRRRKQPRKAVGCADPTDCSDNEGAVSDEDAACRRRVIPEEGKPAERQGRAEKVKSTAATVAVRDERPRASRKRVLDDEEVQRGAKRVRLAQDQALEQGVEFDVHVAAKSNDTRTPNQRSVTMEGRRGSPERWHLSQADAARLTDRKKARDRKAKLVTRSCSTLLSFAGLVWQKITELAS